MLSFNPADFPYQSENKGFDYGAQILDDPLDDFFNQFTNHDSAESGNNASDANPFGSIDFPTDEDTASSESYNNTFSDIAYTNAKRAQNRPEANSLLSQTSGSSQPQSYRRAARTERQKPVISGLELLNLEGKLPPSSKAHIPPLSAPAATPAFPLRRKPRFNATPPETLRDRNHRISKSPCNVAGDPSKMIHPSYYYRQEMPLDSEWTQRFEHISLQTPGSNAPISPPLPEGLYQDEPNTDTQTLSHKFSGETIAQNGNIFLLNENYAEPSSAWVAITVAAIALGNATFVWETRVFQALKIFFGQCWPAFGGGSALRLGVEEKTNPILLVQLSLDVDQRIGHRNLFFLPFQLVSFHQDL